MEEVTRQMISSVERWPRKKDLEDLVFIRPLLKCPGAHCFGNSTKAA